MRSSNEKRPATLEELQKTAEEIKAAQKDPRDPKGYYKIFGLSPCAKLDNKKIEEDFKKLQFRYHPDKQAESKVAGETATELFKILGEAYATFKDEEKRKKYDQDAHEAAHQTSTTRRPTSSMYRPPAPHVDPSVRKRELKQELARLVRWDANFDPTLLANSSMDISYRHQFAKCFNEYRNLDKEEVWNTFYKAYKIYCHQPIRHRFLDHIQRTFSEDMQRLSNKNELLQAIFDDLFQSRSPTLSNIFFGDDYNALISTFISFLAYKYSDKEVKNIRGFIAKYVDDVRPGTRDQILNSYALDPAGRYWRNPVHPFLVSHYQIAKILFKDAVLERKDRPHTTNEKLHELANLMTNPKEKEFIANWIKLRNLVQFLQENLSLYEHLTKNEKIDHTRNDSKQNLNDFINDMYDYGDNDASVTELLEKLTKLAKEEAAKSHHFLTSNRFEKAITNALEDAFQPRKLDSRSQDLLQEAKAFAKMISNEPDSSPFKPFYSAYLQRDLPKLEQEIKRARALIRAKQEKGKEQTAAGATRASTTYSQKHQSTGVTESYPDKKSNPREGDEQFYTSPPPKRNIPKSNVRRSHDDDVFYTPLSSPKRNAPKSKSNNSDSDDEFHTPSSSPRSHR